MPTRGQTCALDSFPPIRELDFVSGVIHAFCLTDNRYHLMVETPWDNLPKIMQYINDTDLLVRQVKLYVCHRCSGLLLREPDRYFGVSESGVTQARRRNTDRSAHDAALRKQLLVIEKKPHIHAGQYMYHPAP